MNFRTAITTVFTKYADFKGVASRPEFWWWTLFSFAVGNVINMLMTITGEDDPNAGFGPASMLSLVWSLGTLIPGLAVQVRRFHDAGFSGKWLLLWIVPFVGFLVAVGSAIPVIMMYLQGSYTQDELATAVLGVLGVAALPLIMFIGMAIFTLVVTVRPSKSAGEGNKYAA